MTETVRLMIPAALEFVRIARLTASAVASRVGFDVEEIEDLRVAVDELSSILVDAASGDELALSFTPSANGIEIEGRTRVDVAHVPEIDELTRQILAAVVDEYGVDTDGDEARFHCSKRATA
jgi:serine/threonine-protein kinase RsbW